MSAAAKYLVRAVLACLVLAATVPVFAQSDAETALTAARKAFAAERFAAARDLLITASQTDAKNPDIHLLLGKAHYQLGEVNQAMAAWRQTLKFAPQQAYAKRMLEVLSDHAVDVDTRLAVVAALVQSNILQPLPVELAKLRAAAKLTDQQRIRLLQLESQYHLRAGKPDLATRSLSELKTRYPDQANAKQVRLLAARARIAVGGPSLAEGLAELAELSAIKDADEFAAAAQLERLVFQLKQGTIPLADLMTWIDGHQDHPDQPRARHEAVTAIQRQLAVSAAGPAAKSEDGLTDTDQQALFAAASVFPTFVTSAEADELTAAIVTHLETHYAASKALAAVAAGLALLDDIKLPPTSDQLVAAARRRLAIQTAAVQLDQIVQDLKLGKPALDALVTWTNDHRKHPQHAVAQAELVAAVHRLLAITTKGEAPEVDTELNAGDRRALAVAATAFAHFATAAQADTLTTAILKHLETHYAEKGAFAAARSGIEALEKIELPPSCDRLIAAATRRVDTGIASAELDKISQQLAEHRDESQALAAWIKGHPDHPKTPTARATLLNWYLATTLRQQPPKQDDAVPPTDIAAIKVAEEIYAKTEKSAEALKLTERLLTHVETRYTARGALSAAAGAHGLLLKIVLPTTSRVRVLHNLGAVEVRSAIQRLTEAAAEHRMVAGPLPEELAGAISTFAEINKLTPATPCWDQQAALADQVVTISTQIPWPDKPTSPKPTHSWAIEIALPVIANGSQPKAVAAAHATVNKIVTELATLNQPSADGLAIHTHEKLIAVLPEEKDAWVAAMLRRADLLTAYSNQLFQRNLAAALPDDNRRLNAPQKQLIESLKTLVAARPSQASLAIQKIAAAVSHNLSAGHYNVVELAYTTIQGALPERQQFDIRLLVARLWVRQVVERDGRRLEKGFEIKKQLDPLLVKAATAAYELQRDLTDDDPRLASARDVHNAVVQYYRRLKMFDVAQQAIVIKAEQPVPAADKYAELQIADLKLELAQRDVARLLATFRGREAIKLTPEFTAALTGYQQFITTYTGDPLARRAVEKLFGIGAIFEGHQRGAIAAEVYLQIEKFAAANKQLGQVTAGQATVAERAALARAGALHRQATRLLNERLAKQPQDAAPPTTLSDAFAQAVAAYQSLIANYPEGVLVKTAIDQTLGIGLEYARANAWDVADKVYGDFLSQKLPLRRPERIEFARAICQVGKVMPAHAQQILGALSQTGRTPTATVGPIQIAGNLDEMLQDFKLDGDLLDAPETPAISGRPLSNTIAATEPREPKPAGRSSPAPAADLPTDATGVLRGEELADAEREANLLAAVERQHGNQAAQVARLRDLALQFQVTQQQRQQADQQTSVQVAAAVLSEAELERQQRVLDKAYGLLQSLRTRSPETSTAKQARGEILVIFGHWRQLGKWDRAAALATRFLQDNPKDVQLPTIRQEVARDYLAWAALGVKKNSSKQHMLDTVNQRFEKARAELKGIVTDFPDQDALRHQAQWDIANSYLTQARVVASLSSTLARGQYVRSANELLLLSQRYHDHPQIGTIPKMLSDISTELAGRGYHDEAISVWNMLSNNYPLQALGQQAALQIAQTYQSQNQPLRAVEAYVELNFSRGGNDQAMQGAIYQVATQLMSQKRWVEALHVLETFVDSFPQHAQAGQALTMIGQIHQTNEVWEDAIAAYDRVIAEYNNGKWTQEARWQIAECTINLSRWSDAMDAYRKFAKAYAKDPKAAVANQRIEILKDLDRYQRVVDEKGQRKSFDAQYQIGSIVRDRLSNSVKSIIEFRKVATHWPDSHLADDALYQVGVTYLQLGDTEPAREALLSVAEKYPNSPLADDSLFMVGKSYEDEARKFAAVTRDSSEADANDLAQKLAYRKSQFNRRGARARQQELVTNLKKLGKFAEADEQFAANSANIRAYDLANAQVIANWASQEAEVLSAAQLADRQDKVNAALRKAVASFGRAATLVSGDKADDALLRMAQIYDQQLKDADKAMETWLEIVKQFSGTAVAEDASWKIADYYEQHKQSQQAINAYQAFLRNYRRSPKAGDAQAAIAENYERLGKWVDAMDAYTNYLNNFPQGPLVARAKEQISWIKTYRL